MRLIDFESLTSRLLGTKGLKTFGNPLSLEVELQICKIYFLFLRHLPTAPRTPAYL